MMRTGGSRLPFRTLGLAQLPSLLWCRRREGLCEKTSIRSLGQCQCILKQGPVFRRSRHKCVPCLARRRSPALKPRKRHAEGVGLDGDAQRQAQRVQAVSADLIQHCPTGRVASFTDYAITTVQALDTSDRFLNSSV
jgi:hypothetical protein